MTQPETPVPEAAAGVEKQDEVLSIESIGWLFIQKYYSSYTSDITKLFAFYDKDASLLHDEFPVSNAGADAADSTGAATGTKTVNLASGTEAIKKHFAAQSLVTETNKIVVERADFQKSVNDSILIVVCGSWKRGGSQLLQFVQTFVLKAKDKTVYDVCNDLLKFLDFSEHFREQEVRTVEANGNGVVENVENVEEEKVEEVPEKVEEKVEGEKPEEVAPEVAEAKAENPEEKSVKVEAETVGTAEVAEKVDIIETESSPEPDAEEPEKSANPESDQQPRADEKPAFALAPVVKPTWANLAAIEPKAPKGTTQPPKTPQVASKKSTPPVQPPQTAAPTNGKFKKEEWYPIYIRNIEIDDDDLKSALVKQFGDIKFYKRTNRAALCDFRNKEDQQKALEAKEIVVKNNVILLETRVHKAYNGKPDFKKDKKQVKKNGVKKN